MNTYKDHFEKAGEALNEYIGEQKTNINKILDISKVDTSNASTFSNLTTVLFILYI